MMDQIMLSALLFGAISLFIWGKWRHDIVAILILVIAVFLGLVPTDEAFMGFGHPAVITVAAVLILSRSLELSGIIDIVARKLDDIISSAFAHMALLTALGAILSAFINNVGALALLMPLAMRTKNPSHVLMPLSFGTILGGMMTEIGTPPNIIIASYREEALGYSFNLFDFSPVGVPVATVGVVFLIIIGWRLIPKKRRSAKQADALLKGVGYITEARIQTDSKLIGQSVRQLEISADMETLVIGIIREGQRLLGMLSNEILREGDILILRADEFAVHRLIETSDLEKIGGVEVEADILHSPDVTLLEAIVKPGGKIDGKTARSVGLHRRHGINLLAIARHAGRINQRIGYTRFKAGDVLLVQGDEEFLVKKMIRLGCMPVADRGLRIPFQRSRLLPLAIFIGSIMAVTLGVAPVQIAFVAAVIALVLFNLFPKRELYTSIDWPVIVLLGALIPIGKAMLTTGVVDTIAENFVTLMADQPPYMVLTVFMMLVMGLTNVINNAAAAVVMAPLAVALANILNVNADPFLMATAISASAAFLTPIGHQNNVLVMSAGGYKFGDYWRIGLPLQLVVLLFAIPLIGWLWPY